MASRAEQDLAILNRQLDSLKNKIREVSAEIKASGGSDLLTDKLNAQFAAYNSLLSVRAKYIAQEKEINSALGRVSSYTAQPKAATSGPRTINDVSNDIKNTRSLIENGKESIETFRKLNELIKERNRLLAAQPGQASQTSTTIGTGDNRVITADNPTAYAKAGADFISDLNALNAEAEKQVSYNKNTTKADKGISEAVRRREELEKQRLTAIEKIKTDPRYAQALQQAGRLGLTADDLRKIEDRGGGVQQLLFNRQSGGVNNNFRAYVDQQGRSTPGLSSQFRSFGSDIVRDIGQFTKWSIAVAAVYTPLQKLSELMTTMVENESRLADATVAANIPFEESGKIFDEVYVAANRAGESLTGVIDAYAQAYRATGGYEDETARAVATTQLLNDALTLSKLSSLEQASAIDTLTAALLQSELKLTEGEALLNKWVRVSQVANVDIATLATGVAVLGDSAETAGLDLDKLNGLIAVLAEQSISGSKEAANTAKALVGAYQSDKAEQTLTKYGFALRRANGETRDFLEVYGDLAKARQEGLLSESNVSEIALALGGGGTRRAKDASALINSYERLNKVAEESRNISGDSTLAQDSLAKTLETVETANTRLSNSFQSLAESLGDNGGLLETFKDLLNVLNLIVSALDKTFEALGRSGPILATTLGALTALRRIDPTRTGAILASLGANQNGNAYGAGFGRGVLADVLQTGLGATNYSAYRGAGIIGAAGVGLSAVSNLRQGEGDRAAGNVIGGIIGGVIGSTLGGPIGIAAGANIGSAIGDTFVSKVLEYRSEWQNLFVPPENQDDNREEGRTPESERDILLSELDKSVSGLEKARSQVQAFLYSIEPGFFASLSNRDTNRNITTEQILLEKAPEDLQKRIEDLRQREIEREQGKDISGGEYTQRRLELESRATQERQRQLERLSEGDITSSEFGNITQRLAGFPSSAIRGVEAFGEAYKTVSKEIKSTSDAYDAFLYIATYGNEEQLNQLAQYTSDIEVLNKVIDTFSSNDIGVKLSLSFGDVTIESKEQLQKILEGTQIEAGTATATIKQQIQFQQLQLPGIVGSATEATSQQDINLIQEQAKKLQDQFYTDMGLANEQIEYLASNLEDFAVLIGDAAENHFDTITGIDQKFWDAARKLLEEQGKLAGAKGLGLQQFDVDRATLERLAGQSLALGQNWQDRFNYDFKPEDQIAISQEGIVKPLHADFRILAILLEKIVDQNQKQLDGQYNIPEGATFWVPLTAAYYRNTQDQGLGDISRWLTELDTENLDTAGTELQTAAQQLSDAANVLQSSNLALLNEARRGGYSTEGSNLALENEKRRFSSGATPKTIGYSDETLGALEDYRAGEKEYSPNPNAEQIFSGAYGRDYSGFFEGIKNFFQSLLGGGGGVGGSAEQVQSFKQSFQQQQSVAPAPTKLDLTLDSTTNLVVDGRVLATILKPFLASDLIRTEASQGTITKKYII